MLNRSNALVVLRELIRHVAVEVDPLDAIGVPAARRNHIHRRHHRLLAHRLLALVCHHLNGIIRQTVTDVRNIPRYVHAQRFAIDHRL
jgi:hypothetical protein